ncbi:unnamed protein product [Rotaria sp. Silwood1]|nr:unnamed protein product [Rotaria sp. Silwood1]CAF5119813.1 unnamed protein product [Rotaria sp. Silwood1]
MNVILRQFANRIEDGDIILFYFSGHGYQIENHNYLIPIGDNQIENEQDIADFSINIQHALQLLVEKNKSYVTIFILDCSTPYYFKNQSITDGNIKGIDINDTDSSIGESIQFICSNNQRHSSKNLFSKYLLDHIATENITIIDIFKHIKVLVYRESNRTQQPLIINQLKQYQKIYLNQIIIFVPTIPSDAQWKSKGITIVGGILNRVHYPQGIYVSHNETIFIADTGHDCIMKYTENGRKARRISNKKTDKEESDRLNRPLTVIQDVKSKDLIICDRGHRRVLRWNRKTSTFTRIIKENIACFGVAMDMEGYVYVSDTEKHEVRRYQPGNKYGTIVAGGQGQGHRLSQLNYPTYIFVDAGQSVYVSDCFNNRVVKWEKYAKKGIIVAGGHGNSKDANQLYRPAGLIVDQSGTIYVADHWNHRIMRWREGETHGEIIAGDRYLGGNCSNQLNGPEGIAFDQHGNLYVADSNNHRIQRFNIQTD